MMKKEKCLICTTLKMVDVDCYICEECGHPLYLIDVQNQAIEMACKKLQKVIEDGKHTHFSHKGLQFIADWIVKHKDV